MPLHDIISHILFLNYEVEMRKNDGISIVDHQFYTSVFSANTATLDFSGGILDKTTYVYHQILKSD